MSSTLMWEAKAADGQGPALLDWALRHADEAADVYRSADGRVVVIDRAGTDPGEPPAELLARPVHRWTFEPVVR